MFLQLVHNNTLRNLSPFYPCLSLLSGALMSLLPLLDECWLHHYTDDTALTSGCFIISQQIMQTMYITLEIPELWGTHWYCIIERPEEGDVYIHISVLHLSFGKLNLPQWEIEVQEAFRAEIVPVLVLVCLVHSTTREAVDSLLTNFTKECSHASDFHDPWKVSLYRIIVISMPTKLRKQRHLFSDFGLWLCNQVLCVRNCGKQKHSLSHFARIQNKAHEGLL
jgi:hypothetical protein